MWDTATGELLKDKKISPFYIRFPLTNGRYFIYNTCYNRIGIYDIITDESIWYAEDKDEPSFMALSPDDKWLIVGRMRKEHIECWNLVRSDDNRISYRMSAETTLGNDSEQPSSIAFTHNNQYFYGCLPNGFL